METYTKKQIVEMIPNLTPRQVQFYTDEGVIKPLEAKSGRGNVRQYTKDNLYELAIISYLANIGITVGMIKDVIETINRFANSFDETTIKDVISSKFIVDENLSSGIIIMFLDGKLKSVSFTMGPKNKHPLSCFGGNYDKNHTIEFDTLIYLDMKKIAKNLPK